MKKLSFFHTPFFYNTACRCQQAVPLIILMSRKGNVHAITLNIPFPMVDFSLSVILRFPHSKTLSDFIFRFTTTTQLF